VVLKLLSPQVSHKSDVGGVALALADEPAVRRAAQAMAERLRSLRPDARLDGFTVQAMIRRPHAHELLVGVATDAAFGPTLMFGQGGTAVEIVDDTAAALPPLNLLLARAQMTRTRVWRLLQPYRDRPAAAVDAVADVLIRLGQLAAEHPEIRELDINPLLADETGVTAVDARVAIGPPQRKFVGSGPANFAVRAYPSQWERRLKLKDDWRIFVRPMRPEDEPTIHEFLRHVTAHDLRLRFFAPMKEFTHEFIARLTQLDYARAMAFIAFDNSNEMVGVVRLHSDSIYERGEYAILLRSDLKGIGLGWELMRLMIEWARTEGLPEVEGQVLRENKTMLEMCKSLGFESRADPNDPDIRVVTLSLAELDERGALES